MINAFPKIFTLGTKYIQDIFKEEVEITEKVDGSQFVFGKINNELFMRSKGKQQCAEGCDKMFNLAVKYVESIAYKLPDNTVFYCEYLNKPKHNVLEYDRIPKNYLILFGVANTTQEYLSNYELLQESAKLLDIECIPLVFKGKINTSEDLLKFLEKTSFLGGAHIEGVVVKNYKRPFMLGDQVFPLMSGKFVSEKFKEVHGKQWKKENTSRGKYQVFVESFRTEARWNKAIQHLSEKSELENSPKDIGKLLKEIKYDIEQEEKERIKDFLWKEFSGEIFCKATAGFPEWYKEKLLKDSFNKGG